MQRNFSHRTRSVECIEELLNPTFAIVALSIDNISLLDLECSSGCLPKSISVAKQYIEISYCVVQLLQRRECGAKAKRKEGGSLSGIAQLSLRTLSLEGA